MVKNQFVEYGRMKMKSQKVWFGVVGFLVLGASVAAFGTFTGKHDSITSETSSQSVKSGMSMTDVSMSMSEGSMSMNSKTCTPDTCGSSVCDGNTCDSPTCSETSCKSMANMSLEMGSDNGMAKMSAQDSMVPQMNMNKSMSPSMTDSAMAPKMNSETMVGQKM